MEPIRVVWGSGTGPTELAAYDAALADANVHEYNLVRLSSVIPTGADLETPGTAPELGEVGDRITVVEASATTHVGPATAALTWARREDGSGVFYEAGADEPPETVLERVTTGLQAGLACREGPFDEPTVHTVTTTADEVDDDHASVAILAVYGSADPLL